MSDEEQAGVISSLDKLYEFEHEPVSQDKLQPGKYFAGLLAGEVICVDGTAAVSRSVRTLCAHRGSWTPVPRAAPPRGHPLSAEAALPPERRCDVPGVARPPSC